MGPSELLILAWSVFGKAIIVILIIITMYITVRRAVKVELDRALHSPKNTDSR